MKLAFKYSLLVLALIVGLFGAVGTYVLFSMEYRINPIQYHHPFLALFNITGFLYHKKTLFFYKKNPVRTRTIDTLDEDFVLDGSKAPHIGSYLWIFTNASALHLIGYSAHFLMLWSDKIVTDRTQWSLTITLALCLYLSIATLLDLVGVSKKTKRRIKQ